MCQTDAFLIQLIERLGISILLVPKLAVVMSKSFQLIWLLPLLDYRLSLIMLQKRQYTATTIIGFVQKNKGLYAPLYGVAQTFFGLPVVHTQAIQYPLFYFVIISFVYLYPLDGLYLGQTFHLPGVCPHLY